MSFSAGAISTSLGLDLSDFSRGIIQGTAIAQTFGPVVTAFMVHPLLGLIETAKLAAQSISAAFSAISSAVKDAGSRFDDMGEAALKAGVSASFLSRIGNVAADAGSSVEGLADALKFLNNNAADAAAGGEVAKAFSDIGVSVTDAGGKLRSTEDLFYSVADAIGNIDSPAKRVQAAMNLLGRGGTDLLAAMEKGAEGIRLADRSINEFGGNVSARRAKLGDDFGKLSSIVANTMQGISDQLTTPILEFVSQNMESILDLMRELVPSAKDLGSAIGTNVAGGLKVVLDIAQSLAPLLRSIMEFLTGIVNAVGQVAGALPEALGFGNYGGGSSARSTAQPTAVTFGSINVTVDSNAIARDVTSQLTPGVRDAINRVRTGVEGSARVALVGRGL